MKPNRKLAVAILQKLLETKRIHMKDISGEYKWLWTIEMIEQILDEKNE